MIYYVFSLSRNNRVVLACLYKRKDVTKLVWFTTKPQEHTNVLYVLVSCITGNSFGIFASHIGTCIHSHIAC